jgi:4-nitrophenyl phosphatase
VSEEDGTPLGSGRILRTITHLLVDMDGVLFRGGTALPRAAEFLPWLRSRDIRFQLLTNNATLTPEQNIAKLACLGIEAGVSEILTSAEASALFLQRRMQRPLRVYVVGEVGLRKAMVDIGAEIVDGPDGVDWVVAGLDRAATYDSLKTASLAIERGARFLATNSDKSLPVEDGQVPGAGALQAVITATTGVYPQVVGKPEPLMLELAMERIGGDAVHTAMLGDRLDTDILAAARLHMPSILVLTGVTTPEELSASQLQPSLSVCDLPELMDTWERALTEPAPAQDC